MDKLELTVVRPPRARNGFLAALGIADDVLLAIGGIGTDPTVLVSSNATSFHPRQAPNYGLRGLTRARGKWFLVGEYGFFAVSSDDGTTWERIDTGTKGCLFSVLEHEGALWLCGDDGWVARYDLDRGVLAKVPCGRKARWHHIASAHGALWLLGQDGALCRLEGETAKMVSKAKQPLTRFCQTRTGTLIVTGDHGVLLRSTDRGVTFSPVATDARASFEAIAALADGRVVVVGGETTILVSEDDGATFTRLDVELDNIDELWSVVPFGAGAIIGCQNGAILRLAPAGDTTWSDHPDRFAVALPLDAVFEAGPDGFLDGRLGQFVAASAEESEDEDEDEDEDEEDEDEGDEEEDEDEGDEEEDDDDESDEDEEDEGGEEAWQKPATAYARKLWSGDTSCFQAVWGVPPPPELVAFEKQVKDADAYSTFCELRLDVSLLGTPPDDKNLFEMIVYNDQLNFLGTGLYEVFGGVACIGSLGNGDTYHFEVYDPADEDETRSRCVVFWDHEEGVFSNVFADSLASLAYLCALCASADKQRISESVARTGYEKLRGRVAPSWHFSMDERDPDFVEYEHPKEAELVRYFCARALWIIRLLRNDDQLEEVRGAFFPQLNDVLSKDMFPARLEACRKQVTTALYAMWRAYLFDEPELEELLAVGRAHKARLARDAAKLIDELRAGRKSLGKISDWPHLLERFRALDLDPRRAEGRNAEAARIREAEAARATAIAKSVAELADDRIDAFAWEHFSDALARQALVQRGLASPARAAALEALEYLQREGYSVDNCIYRSDEYEACVEVARHADGLLQALLLGEAIAPAPEVEAAAEDEEDEEDEDEDESDEDESDEDESDEDESDEDESDEEDEGDDDDKRAEQRPLVNHMWQILPRIARAGRLDARALPPLRSLIAATETDERFDFRVECVVEILGLARDRGAVAPLLALLAKCPATGGFDVGLKYNDVLAAIARTLRVIGDPAAAPALVRFAESTSMQLREARTESALAIGVLAPAVGTQAMLDSMLELVLKANDTEENATAFLAYGLIGSARPAAEHAALAERLAGTEAMAEDKVEVKLAKAVALSWLGRSDVDPAPLVAKALTEPAWKEDYTVRRRHLALLVLEQMRARGAKLDAALIAECFSLHDEGLTHAAGQLLARLGHVPELPPKLTWFQASKMSESALRAALADRSLGSRHHAAVALRTRASEENRVAIERAVEAVIAEAPRDPGADLPETTDRFHRELIRTLCAYGESPSTIALFNRLLLQPSRDLKSPVLSASPPFPALAEGMRHVVAEAWGWQESTAKKWLKQYGR